MDDGCESSVGNGAAWRSFPWSEAGCRVCTQETRRAKSEMRKLIQSISGLFLGIVMFFIPFLSGDSLPNTRVCEGSQCVPPQNGPQNSLVYDKQDKFSLHTEEEEVE